jgi:hypothetical protein
MLAVLRRRLETAVRVRDYLRAHRAEGIQGGEAAALARLEELLARAEVLAAQQRAGVLARRGSTEQRAEVRRALQSQLLKYLSAVGRVAARGTRSWARTSGCRRLARPIGRSSRWGGAC